MLQVGYCSFVAVACDVTNIEVGEPPVPSHALKIHENYILLDNQEMESLEDAKLRFRELNMESITIFLHVCHSTEQLIEVLDEFSSDFKVVVGTYGAESDPICG